MYRDIFVIHNKRKGRYEEPKETKKNNECKMKGSCTTGTDSVQYSAPERLSIRINTLRTKRSETHTTEKNRKSKIGYEYNNGKWKSI